MGPRAGLSSVLILGAIVLLVAIAVGQNMGNRVLGQIASHGSAISATPIPTPTASSGDPADAGAPGTALWKRREVISVATDPGFPDPRVTPEPPPPPTARPTPRPTPTPTEFVPTDAPERQEPAYTSPPLPVPLVSRAPDATGTPDAATSATPAATPTGRGVSAAGAGHPAPASPGRSYPTLPPYSTPIP